MKEKRKANFQPRLLYAALALGGVSMIAIALAGDWLVIGGQPGFGQRQLAFAIAGGFMLFTAMGLHTGKFQAWTQKTILLTTRMKEVAPLLSLLIPAALMNGFLMVRNPNIGGDALKYHSVIQNLMAGKGYIIYDGSLGRVEPGYGLLSYAVFLILRDIELSGMLVSAISYILIIPTTYYTVRFLFGRRCAFLASFLVAFWPTLISYSYINLTDSVFTFFLLLSFSAYIRILLGKSSLLKSISLGLLLGFTYLIRPEGFLVAVPTLLSLFILPIASHIRWKKGFLFLSTLKRLLHPAVTVIAFLPLALTWILFLRVHTGIWTFTYKMVTNQQVVVIDESRQIVMTNDPSDDLSNTQEGGYRYVNFIDPLFIKQSIRSWLSYLIKINFHALTPLALLWMIFPFLSSRRLFAKVPLGSRNVKIVLAFIIFSSPLLIYLTFLIVDRYLMPYFLYILIFLAFLIDRLLARILESLETEHFNYAVTLVCIVSLLSLSGFASRVVTNVKEVITSPYSLYETLTDSHGHLGLRAAGFWLQEHVQNINDLTIITPRKGVVALFYASGKKEPKGKNIPITPDMTLQEVTALLSSGEADYLLLDNWYVHTRQQLMPLWDNPGLAQGYGLFLVYRDTDGLFQVYTAVRKH